ncbi:MAG: polymerase, archaea type [Chloroflexota bacterium]|jgi:DNA polymerase elongation subunit (family B)|nr:polymerase, archaea type [Chloroflexota bacterium]
MSVQTSLFDLAGSQPALDRQALLFGRDPTPGIVSVSADRRGRARIWRRVGDQVVQEEDSYPNWFFLARRELLGELPIEELPVDVLEGKPTAPSGKVGLITLRGSNPFKYLVLTDQLDEVEAQITGAAARGLENGTLTEPLSELIYVRPVAEQYLTITGRTYFKGMTYAEVRRLQFDFETTGLGAAGDRIFMVSIKDSTGFEALLDIGSMDEAQLLRELVRIIQERDPDIIENHNIFDFDIRFMIKRAQALGVPLALGRDGTEFWESRDSVKIGAQNQPFTRYSLTGREIVDTLHATRRFGAIQRDLRSAGLKDAAKYFGVAAEDREYVEGAEIWHVFQSDPDRIRRYCFDDVEEVDQLSRLLLASAFALASIVPKQYEKIATAGTGQGLIEPLLVRAYVANGCSLPQGKMSGSYAGGRTAIFTTGVVQNVVKADVASLYPSIMLAERVSPAADECGAFLDLLDELTSLRLQHKAESRRPTLSNNERAYHDAMQSAMKVLINSFYGSLGANFALFCDKDAAERVTARGREILQMLLDELERRGALLVEADTDGVLFSLPTNGNPPTYEGELALIEDVAGAMPAGIHVEHDGRYRAMYSYHEKNYALLDYEEQAIAGYRQREPIRLVGSAFKSAKTEPLIERFLAEAVKLVLLGDMQSLRDRYRAVCASLRAREVPAASLSVSMPLTKSPDTYGKAKRKEEPYEVYLAAGHTGWRPGQRINYYQTRGGKKLLEPGATDYDPDYYIARLRSTLKQRLERAFTPEDLDALLTESEGLFDIPIGNISPISVTSHAQLQIDEPAEEPAEGESEAE